MNSSVIEKDFIDMVRQCEKIIYKVCSFYLTDNYLLADLYQDVVCQMWSAYPRYRHECSMSTWVYRIALNTCISGLRRKKSNPQNVMLTALPDIIDNREDKESEIGEMYKLINRLKSLEKALILLYLEDKSYQEMSDITGLSVSNVAVKLMRIKEKLRKMSNS